MARFARVVATSVPHHITQRGNARREVFPRDADRHTYLGLLREQCELYQLPLIGYCLMSNHVHLVAVPRHAESMALTLRYTHGRYAAYLNVRERRSGHVWQGRYFSCPLGPSHLWAALRYVERNPVRAGLVESAETYEWSSAAAHCRDGGGAGLLDLDVDLWQACWTPSTWRRFIGADSVSEPEGAAELEAIRQSTHTGRPLGTEGFVRDLERRLGRALTQRPGGRPPKAAPTDVQQVFNF
jgi:REP-associated tyrosine transposase